jgi:hypothetical protein
VVQRLSSEHKVEDGAIRKAERVRAVRLARTGQRLLKKVIRDVAFRASLGNGVLRSLFERHVRRGKSAAIARVTLARKISAVILRVWRSGIAFDAAIIRKGMKSSGRASEGELGRQRTRAARL